MNLLPVYDLEKGLVIDGCASDHMISFGENYRDIQNALRKSFLADGPIVICKEICVIDIPIQNGKIILGIPTLDNVLIVPSSDERI